MLVRSLIIAMSKKLIDPKCSVIFLFEFNKFEIDTSATRAVNDEFWLGLAKKPREEFA